MNNQAFLNTLKRSFLIYLSTTARSNQKLKVLHGAIARDLAERLGDGRYSVASLGYEAGKEEIIPGRYYKKAVDIAVKERQTAVAAVGVKYVMSNYMQNSNNYFENMLGETANIRCNGIPYFQIFVIPDRIPYFEKDGTISKWESLNAHHLNKYIILSDDNPDVCMHTPNRTLVFIINISSEAGPQPQTARDYKAFYLNHPFSLTASKAQFAFGKTIVYNNYELYADEVVRAIRSL